MRESDFDVLVAVQAAPSASQRALAEATGRSLGAVNGALRRLREQGWVEDGRISVTGLRALEPYRVRNAVILAAGLSSRLAPISYEKPKGLLKVRGEVLIERQIRQLKEAGVDDVTLVVGYKKEQFFYLEDLYGVRIVVNEVYAERNNHSSLMAVVERLGNTYVCSSDDYFAINPFSAYEWKAFYAAQYAAGETEEWCMGTGPGRRITSVTVGGADSWYMLGHAYFDQAFSRRFSEVLREEYDRPETKGKLWESLYVDHIGELDMVMRPYEEGAIREFDTLDELREFDDGFLENVDSDIFDNIASVLGCRRDEIRDVYPLKQGLTNLSCHFAVGEGEYVYRHPGVGTEELIDRGSEAAAQAVAKELGLDRTFIFEDEGSGWKLSRFIRGCRTLDADDDEQLGRAMAMARKLHGAGVEVGNAFDFYEESRRYEGLLGGRSSIDIPGYHAMAEGVDRLHRHVEADGGAPCLSHNDFFPLNLLIDPQDGMHLIDWEYAGMSDPASDFGTFVVCAQLAEGRALDALRMYLGQDPSPEELRHHLAFVALAGWCWYLWSLYKESCGESVGEWLHVYYRYAKDYLAKALALYEGGAEALDGGWKGKSR